MKIPTCYQDSSLPTSPATNSKNLYLPGHKRLDQAREASDAHPRSASFRWLVHDILRNTTLSRLDLAQCCSDWVGARLFYRAVLEEHRLAASATLH
jgi:hypothetical protein